MILQRSQIRQLYCAIWVRHIFKYYRKLIQRMQTDKYLLVHIFVQAFQIAPYRCTDNFRSSYFHLMLTKQRSGSRLIHLIFVSITRSTSTNVSSLAFSLQRSLRDECSGSCRMLRPKPDFRYSVTCRKIHTLHKVEDIFKRSVFLPFGQDALYSRFSHSLNSSQSGNGYLHDGLQRISVAFVYIRPSTFTR